jgi:hypothetical protein
MKLVLMLVSPTGSIAGMWSFTLLWMHRVHGRYPFGINAAEGGKMTLAELKRLLDDLGAVNGVGPDTPVFIDDPAGGLQNPVFSTSEKVKDGRPIIIIETPKDTVKEVS